MRSVRRRGKYLLLDCGDGHLILHLGMSGSLRLVRARDHSPGSTTISTCCSAIRFCGCAIRGASAPCCGPRSRPRRIRCIRHLGVEPLSRAFNARRLHALTRASAVQIKPFLMDGRRVVGVGNIYASESLFLAGIHPRTRAGRLSPARGKRLVSAIKGTLRTAIRAGGSSLRDFVGSDGAQGYFQRRAWVYGRAGEPCRRCGTRDPAHRAGTALDLLLPRLPALSA